MQRCTHIYFQLLEHFETFIATRSKNEIIQIINYLNLSLKKGDAIHTD